MKPSIRLFGMFLCLCLLSACGAPPDNSAGEEPFGSGVPYEMTCRLVDGADTGKLLLAEQDGAGIYTLSLSDTLTQKPDAPLKNGQLLTIRYQSVQETWPGQFQGVSEILPSETGFDNRCALYLQVLEDLWEKDSGLNGGVEVIGLDLFQTSLSPAERSAVGWAFAAAHGAEVVEGAYEDLLEQGYISAEPISATGCGIIDLNDPKHFFYEWKNGCLFSIKEQEMAGSFSLIPVTFDAQKWRSSLGAYFFSGCTALQSATGEWSDYQIGSEMIS